MVTVGPIKIYKERLEVGGKDRKDYFFRPYENEGKLSKCLILNIPKTEVQYTLGIEPMGLIKVRTGAKNEVEKVKKCFEDFSDVKVLEEETDMQSFDVLENIQEYIKENDHEKDMQSFDVLENIQEYIKENDHEKGFKAVDAFFCIILAFGGPGFIYDSSGNKVSLYNIIKKFQNCKRLITKPKIFIVQACDRDLQPVSRELFGDKDQDYSIHRWPMEADILIYESGISGEYSWYPGLKNFNSSSKALEPCEFIKTLTAVIKDEKKGSQESDGEQPSSLNFDNVLMKVNEKLAVFIKRKNNWCLKCKEWSSYPRMPVITDQLTKDLKIPLFTQDLNTSQMSTSSGSEN